MILFNIHHLIIMEWCDVKKSNKRIFMTECTHLPKYHHCQRPHCCAVDSRSRWYTLRCYWDQIDGSASLGFCLHRRLRLFDVMDLAARRWLNDSAGNLVARENEVWEAMLATSQISWNIDIVAACNCYRVNDDDDDARDCWVCICSDFAVAHAIAAASLTVAFDLWTAMIPY